MTHRNWKCHSSVQVLLLSRLSQLCSTSLSAFVLFTFSAACVDLIRHLLQVKPSQRITLLEVMDHPWITKHGLYLLHPYKPLPQDQEAHKKVKCTKSSSLAVNAVNFMLQIIQLISTQLDLTKHEIENAVSTNKCDWIAAIFHLLIDQPEGRTYMSQIAVETSYDRSRTSLGLSPELALIETSIARSENVEKDNKTASEQSEERDTYFK